MRGCWRLLWRDPAAFEDFNVSIEGFWRSFAMILPLLVLTYLALLSEHKFGVEFAKPGEDLPEWKLGAEYAQLLSSILIWALIAAVLAKLFGVAQNYVRYMIIYNWMAVPTMTLAIMPQLLYLATGATAPVVLAYPIVLLLLYVSWYVAKTGLETTAPVAFAFLIADVGLTFGLDALIR